MEISNQIKQKVIDLFLNTRMNLTQIQENINKYYTSGYNLTMEDIIDILENYKKNSNQKVTRNKFNDGKKAFVYNKNISNAKIVELVENDFSNKDIADYFTKLGHKISPQAIAGRKEKIYGALGLPVPKVRDMRRKRKQEDLEKQRKQAELDEEILNERIFKFRLDEKMSFAKIARMLSKEGIPICTDSVKKRCEEVFKKHNMELTKLKCGVKPSENVVNIDEEELFNLREHGCTGKELAEYFEVPYTTVLKLCRKIYNEKGLEQPIEIISNRTNVSDELLLEMKNLGLTYKEISEFLYATNNKISPTSVSRKVNKICNERNEEVPRCNNYYDAEKTIRKTEIKNIDKNTLKAIMDYIKVKKNATDEQMEEFYKYYGIELDEKDRDER